MTIALLVPSRGRPEQLKRMIESACKTCTAGMPNIYLAPSAGSGSINFSYVLDLPENLPTVHKWNALAETALRNSNNKLFMLAADDMIFSTEGWDKALLEHYDKLENKVHVYSLQDSRDANGFPHPIVSREYIEAMGYAFPPIFLHWFLDTWTIAIAKANSCFTHMKDYLLTHDKPSDRGEGDETHNRIRDFGWHGRDKYVNDKCQHFLGVEKDRLRTAINNRDKCE